MRFALLSIAFCVAFACGLRADAAPISELETDGQAINNTTGTAQSIPGSAFTLPVPPTVFNPPGYSTATILGRGGSTDVDFYRFSASGGNIILDIDDDPFSFDSMLFLFDSTGTLLAFNDDSYPEDPGTESGLDGFLGVYTLPGPGDYYIAVSNFANGIPDDFTNVTALLRPDGEFGGYEFPQGGTATATFFSGEQQGTPYTLHVSLQNANDLTVPEPASLALWGIGSVGLAWAARRRRTNNKTAT